MHQHLHARLQEADGDVRVSVSRQQQKLEEEHAGAPHRRRAAEPRQNHLGDERLHLEQQKGAQKNGNGVESHLICGHYLMIVMILLKSSVQAGKPDLGNSGVMMLVSFPAKYLVSKNFSSGE